MRKVLFDEAAELGVKTFPIDIWLLSPPPKIELDVPGVEGWAMMFAQWGILLRGGIIQEADRTGPGVAGSE